MSTAPATHQPTGKNIAITALTSQELATSLFEEMTLGRQRAIMAVAAVIAPEAGR